MSNTTLAHIESAAGNFADARECLAEIVGELNRELNDLQAAYIPRIRKAVKAAAARKAEGIQLVENARDLFADPRTQIFHGVKVGLRKGTGSIEFDDEAQVIDLIERKLKDQVEFLVKTTKELRKKNLKALEASDLAKIGCTLEDAGDVVIFTPVDGAVDKAVKALLKNATDEAIEQKEAA